jgi:catechol 2,3-dioxygenase-like lactoylglutathione lyase family enzyme
MALSDNSKPAMRAERLGFTHPPGLDHVGLLVPDLDAATHAAEALGFTTTARVDHTRRDAEGREVPAGSAQRCLMFERGYVELLAVTDPARGHFLIGAEPNPGAHILAFGTLDAEAERARLLASGIAASPVQRWSRPVRERDRRGVARFTFFARPYEPRRIGPLTIWVQHLDPDLVRSPVLCAHPNGVSAIDAVRIALPPDDAAHRADFRAYGASPEGRISPAIELRVDASLTAPRIVALRLIAGDPEAVTSRARAAGFAVTGLEIDLRRAFGCTFEVVAPAS